ncbi:GDP-fucose protein O-fucosyltransferase [Macleaya cordata]|uniref:O-fucosyltransferase family protein n=1 Tax=Macleaya cordata TaxID=56857 RepID=A0A200RDV9_MACCD|nr:GDP-fucose protein O-fucosyltransferase [Macleaya cordata]
MQKRRCRSLVLLRTVLSCAIFVISIIALLSVHLHIFLFSKVPAFSDSSYKLPSQHEIGHQRLSGELRWTQEFSPPQFAKVPPPSQKLNVANGNRDFEKLWKPPQSRDFVPCVEPSPLYSRPTESRGYLLVHTNGGLNQMRAGICDMVAVARIINATLVIPELDKRSFWQDSSNFSDVFDEDHFISALANDVRVIKKLPKELRTATRGVKHFRSWSGIDYYQDEIARMWEEYQVIRAAKSDSRLANNNLPPDIQKLRCRVHYEALRFAPRVEAMGKLLVERMRSYGPYIALHLRYEKDMLAFSGCTHGLSPAEADELTMIRENTAYWKVKDIDSREQRSKGYCPLTPKEVGMFLAALGYPSNTPIYIAAGEIYGGDKHMTDLLSRFPLLMSKEKLASVEELEPFTCHATQMAALDYIVSVESDVFIPSYSGNMARAVEGHRRFLGHRKTISPDRKALVHLFDKIERGSIKEGKGLSDRIVEIHKRRQGSPRKRKGPISGTKGMERFRSEEAFYVNPLPDCLCQEPASINTSYTSSSRVGGVFVHYYYCYSIGATTEAAGRCPL